MADDRPPYWIGARVLRKPLEGKTLLELRHSSRPVGCVIEQKHIDAMLEQATLHELVEIRDAPQA